MLFNRTYFQPLANSRSSTISYTVSNCIDVHFLLSDLTVWQVKMFFQSLYLLSNILYEYQFYIVKRKTNLKNPEGLMNSSACFCDMSVCFKYIQLIQ